MSFREEPLNERLVFSRGGSNPFGWELKGN
jgi:hypothetical protein